MKTFSLNQAGFDRLRTRLLQLGISLPSGTDGTIAQSGCELKYHFDAQQQKLTLAILKKPWIAPEAMIWDKVSEWLAG